MNWAFFKKSDKCFCGGCGVVGNLIWGLVGLDVLEGADLVTGVFWLSGTL